MQVRVLAPRGSFLAGSGSKGYVPLRRAALNTQAVLVKRERKQNPELE